MKVIHILFLSLALCRVSFASYAASIIQSSSSSSGLGSTVFDNGTCSGSLSMNLSQGAIHKFTQTNSTCTVTLTNGVSGGTYFILLTQFTGATPQTVFTGVKWPGGAAPNFATLNSGSLAEIQLTTYDGTTFIGTFVLNLS